MSSVCDHIALLEMCKAAADLSHTFPCRRRRSAQAHNGQRFCGAPGRRTGQPVVLDGDSVELLFA